MKLIETKGLKKIYKVGQLMNEVLKGIDFDVFSGDFLSIIGPSGSGKTTLLYVLGGLEPYNSGTVHLFGKELNSFSKTEKASLHALQIGFVFQFYNLIPNLNVYENVLLASVIGKKQSREDIIRVLQQVGMDDYLNYYPNQLSGGMQQRVAIARCLINEPEIIFADEPIGNLDYHNGLSIMELFSKLNKTFNKTIVMVTHNEDMIKYGNRVIHMLDGKVISDEKLI